jgi:hypothetical protein
VTRYEQKPSGWWQDSKNRMQPPGSYGDPTLRLTGEQTGLDRRRSSTARVRRFVDGVWHRRATAAVSAALSARRREGGGLGRDAPRSGRA